MKMKGFNYGSSQGSVLLLCLVIACLIGITLASYLTLAENQSRSVYLSQTWNCSIPVSEAGIEEAMALINKYAATSTPLDDWTNSGLADGWDCPAAGVYHVLRYIDPTSFYEVYITNANNSPTIKCTGTVLNNYFSAQGPQALFASAGVSTPSSASTARAVVVATQRKGAFSGAILVKGGILLSGGSVIDSFNSQDPNYSSNGQYVVSRRKDGGDIGTIASNLVAAVSESGGADVYGHAATGPNSTITTSSSSAIGSIDYISHGGVGVQSGWSRSDLNMVINDTAAPDLTGASTYSGLSSFPSGSPGNGNTTNYTYLVSPVGGTGKYKITGNINLGGSQNMCINGNVTLAFLSTANNSFVTSGSAFIYITPGSTLKMYFYGGATISGSGVVNPSGYATNCACYGMPTCTTLTYSGGSGFIGTIYVPEADVTLSGGSSSNPLRFIGSLVANSVNLSGSYAFHYDESLNGPTGPTSFYITSWKEVKP